ncbi:MAG: potassium transporter TrkG [Pelagibacteraceae bacterium]
MNLRAISYYIGLFCFPLSFLAFLNILYSSYFDYFLNTDSYSITLIASLLLGFVFYSFGKEYDKKINFHEQLILIILIYIITSSFIAIPYYLSNYQISLIDSFFESFSGVTGTGFSIFENIKYLDPTLIIWRSSSQWIGGLYFLIFLILFFSNSQFYYKLNHLVFSGDKSNNPELNIKGISLKLFFIYVFLTFCIFFLFSLSGIRLFNGLNLSMTIISAGGFLPTNSLNDIIKTTIQEFFLVLSFLVAILNIFFIYNLFNKKFFLKEHYEDFAIFALMILFSIILLLSGNNLDILTVFSNIFSSISTSGISGNKIVNNFSLFLLFLTIIGGSLISNTSGIKFIRFYILLKSAFTEILKLVRPNNIVDKNILISNKKINNENIKISFLIFISFFISLFILSGVLLLDNINFEKSFKLSILTLTNTTNSDLYSLGFIEFRNLLTSSKLSIIIFMIIGKIELISIFLIIKKIFFKN